MIWHDTFGLTDDGKGANSGIRRGAVSAVLVWKRRLAAPLTLMGVICIFRTTPTQGRLRVSVSLPERSAAVG
jgi:hypothetical protein